MDNQQNSNITLEDLKKSVYGDEMMKQQSSEPHETVIDTTTMINSRVEVPIEQIRPYKEEEYKPNIIDNEFAKLRAAVDNEEHRIRETQAEAYAMIEENEREKEDTMNESISNDDLGSLFNDKEYSVSEKEEVKKVIVPSTPKPAINTKVSDDTLTNITSGTNNFLDDFNDEDYTDDEEEAKRKEEEKFNKIRKVVSEKIVPFENNVDLSTFTISKKTINSTRALAMNPISESTADWVLYGAKKPITMRALNGSDIQKMDTSSNSKNTLNAYKEIYKILYDHIVDDNKPNFEDWLKVTKFSDDSDLFFAAYMATFNKNHSIPYTCTDETCEEVFMADLSFKDLVKFDTEDVASEVEKIRNMDITSANTDEYPVELHQISDEYVVALRNPSLYHVLFEPRVLDSELVEKYIDLIGLMSYIDAIYVMDKSSNELIEINTYPDRNNASKTAIHRYREFYKILSTLTSDQQAVLEKKIAKIDETNSKIKYILPEVTCPKCGSVIEETEISPLTMLFMRHRVAKLGDF